MMAITHCALAAAGTAIILGSVDPLPLGLAILGSQLPDLDTSTSTLGQILFPISQWIEKKYIHRTITHSLLATLTIAGISLSIGYLCGEIVASAALPIGHFIACFSDCFTRKGVQIFYPKPIWCVAGSNPNRRLETGSPGEYWILCSAIAIFFIAAHLITGGGISNQFAQSMGLGEDVASKLYTKESSAHHIWAEVKGVSASARSRIDGKYFIAGIEAKNFILVNEKGLFRTGKNILTERLIASQGAPATTSTQVIVFKDEEIDSRLLTIAQSNPNSLILLSGDLRIDSPDSVQPEQKPDFLAILELTGNRAKLDYAPIDQVRKALSEQYGTGNLNLKIITPRPL